jgi:hypothetical protein
MDPQESLADYAGDPSAAGRVSGEGAWPGTPLTVAWDGMWVTLSRRVSCMPSDSDYEIYEGTIGFWYSREMRYRSTGGLSTMTFTPLAGNSDYLVVPTNGTCEGSYGTNSAGAERPQGSPACPAQQGGSCLRRGIDRLQLVRASSATPRGRPQIGLYPRASAPRAESLRTAATGTPTAYAIVRLPHRVAHAVATGTRCRASRALVDRSSQPGVLSLRASPQSSMNIHS